MVAEPWFSKMGNQVSGNFKNVLIVESLKKSSSFNKKQGNRQKLLIGILSFEVANVMSKIIHLHKSLADSEISELKNEIFKSAGIRTLVSDDETKLLELALIEKLDDLHRIACVVSRLGKKCTLPALQGFEHVYGDIISGAIDVKELGFLVKDMEGRVRKMERYVNSTKKLYKEMEVVNELEIATKKFEQNHLEESKKAFEQKLVWQRQDVRHLKDVSLWNQTHDKVVELLARTVCTIYMRICMVLRDAVLRRDTVSTLLQDNFEFCGTSDNGKQQFRHELDQISTQSRSQTGMKFRKTNVRKSFNGVNSKPHVGLQRSEGGLFGPEDFNFACGMGPGRFFMECINLSSLASNLDDDNDDDMVSHDTCSQISGCYSIANSLKAENPNLFHCFTQSIRGVPSNVTPRQSPNGKTSSSRFGSKGRFSIYAPPTTIGGSALALHYANVIIVIEKLLHYPHLVGEEARDDLYQMLPTSLRKSLKKNLKPYLKDLAIYDAPLAHDWKARLDGILKWLAPMAHNMIRWQNERNVEQQQIVTRTNILLLQTLYFADRSKTEATICELLVGLNYICRYEHQQNALLDCSSSFDLEDYMEWQLQLGVSFNS